MKDSIALLAKNLDDFSTGKRKNIKVSYYIYVLQKEKIGRAHDFP